MALTQAHPLEVLRKRTSEKWRTYPDNVLPMFVAEMDFPLAPAIRSALHDAIELGDTGYVDCMTLRSPRRSRATRPTPGDGPPHPTGWVSPPTSVSSSWSRCAA